MVETFSNVSNSSILENLPFGSSSLVVVVAMIIVINTVIGGFS